MRKYLKVWLIFAKVSFQMQAANRLALVVFLLGKILRFGVFLFFIVILLNQTKALAGYNLDQTIFFYLIFNLMDISSQLFFREVYRFRTSILVGSFDFSLLKPLNPLFRSLTAGPDLLDLITLIPLVGVIIYLIPKLGNITLFNFIIFLSLIICGFIISLSIHILLLTIAVLTAEVDYAVLIYRDLNGVGRMPIDIFKEPLRGFLTFIIPIGLMISYPVKALLGQISSLSILYVYFFSFSLVLISIRLWKIALKSYTSVGG